MSVHSIALSRLSAHESGTIYDLAADEWLSTFRQPISLGPTKSFPGYFTAVD